MDDYNAVLKQQENTLQVSSDYILMGALMHRDDRQHPEWEFYLRDYISSDDGKLWRVLSESNHPRNDIKISSDQALADIQGGDVVDKNGNRMQPSTYTQAFRPIYLFYCNRTMVVESMNAGNMTPTATTTTMQGGQSSNEQYTTTGSGITLADYILDEDEQQYSYENPEDDKACKICGIEDIIEDVNNMFYCDECNLGVHQFCEDPPIQQFETEIDPWFCRECSRRRGIPLPQPINEQALVLPSKRPGDEHDYMDEVKRRRDELSDGNH
ncbi:hypothetical protein BDA99DRAFT_442087 [Phascolomyces articulosus]|uniref:PHD-type domain-containing protein n=1 Tax=Phascolomyces articulosus TaxID=60185 RepID=A0AAD5K4H0_9FUNG|nr:hypothetical protein BDA99DRAFT_442087 [Phascolomyces articulosus]